MAVKILSIDWKKNTIEAFIMAFRIRLQNIMDDVSNSLLLNSQPTLAGIHVTTRSGNVE